jgi:hypothetical protein
MLRNVFHVGMSGVWLMMLSATVGCGGASDTPELATVQGIVTVDGKPTANLLVEFQVKGDGGDSLGTTDASGQYTLTHLSSEAGAAVGEYTVSITRENPGGGPAGGEQGLVAEDPLPAKYNTNSELTATVKSGDNGSIDFKLETGK